MRLGRFREGKVGLALGGGAARGLAHIGVLKVLEEEGIRVGMVAGTSAGSLVGALHCAGYGWREIREIAGRIQWRDLVGPTWPVMGLLRTTKLEKALEEILGHRSFEQLGIPFRAVAVDIGTGEEVLLSSGPVAQAVRASASIPGIFEPVLWEGRLLVDGGLVNDVPADVVRAMGAELVIGVDLNADRIDARPPQNFLDIFYRSLNLLIYNSTQRGRRSADLMITPALSGIGYHELKRMEELIERGERAARRELEKLRRGRPTTR
jgi:NTE family protein